MNILKDASIGLFVINMNKENSGVKNPTGKKACGRSCQNSCKATWIVWLLGIFGILIVSGILISGESVGEEPDLNLEASDIEFSNDNPNQGESIFINATIHKSFDPIKLTDSEYDEIIPVWSPDGNLIVYRSDESGHQELWLMNSDGSDKHQLTNIEDDLGKPDVGFSAWTPDGKTIYFCTGSYPSYDIYKIDVDGTNLSFVIDYKTRDSYPVISPDGKFLYFRSDPNWTPSDEIIRANLDGTNPVVIDGNDGISDGSLTISNDGSTFLVAHDESGSGYSGPNNIYMMDVDGSNKSKIFTRSGEESFYIPSFSSDMEKILYEYRPNPEADRMIGIMDSNGSNRRLLSPRNKITYAISPGLIV